MRIRRIVIVILTGTGLMAGSFTFGYVARRNEWISISTRHQVRTLVGKVASAWEGSVTRDSTGIPEGEFNSGDGNWSRVDPTPTSPPIIDGEAVETLNALGYLDGYEAPTSSESGVVLADTSRCFGGYRLYVSGHKPEARLIAADGALVHTWTVPYARAFPDIPPHETYAGRFRKAYVYPGGDLLVIFDLAGVVKLRVDSEIVWTHSGRSHHDLHVQPDGTIYVIDSAAESIPEQENAIVDYITHLSENGEVMSRTSVVECFRNSPYSALLTHVPKVWDILHTNTLHILSDKEKALFGPPLSDDGRVSDSASPIALVSCREIDTVALVDLNRRAVVWALTGMWKGQHHPMFTDRGTLLVFDNRSLGNRSRLVEVDPSSQAVVWEYVGSPDRPFNSEIGGSLYRLPNGNVFVVETIRGRAFELTRERDIVWEFVSPHRVQSEGEELVANLYDMVPIAAEQASFVAGSSGR